MAGTRRRVDYAHLGNALAFELTPPEQRRVEELYKPITPELWEEIFTITTRYTMLEAASQAAPEVRQVRSDLRSVSKLTKKLIGKFKIPTKPPVLRFNSKTQQYITLNPEPPDPLEAELWKERLPSASKGNMFPLYLELLKWVASYTDMIEQAHLKGFYIDISGTGLWAEWIRELNQLMREHGLPAGMSKNKVLPFTRFVSGLQKEMKNNRLNLSSCVRQGRDEILAEQIYHAVGRK